jgi:hypothetical protein
MRIPRTVRTVADVIGLPAAVRLMRVAYKSPHSDGGSKLYVPSSGTLDHRLTSVLQPDEFKALTRTFGGELLSYPSARGMRRRIKAERKAEAIREDIAKGLPTAEIARKHGVSDKYVYRIRSKGETSSMRAYPLKSDNRSHG